uniref:Uncharacterized protein n=1 Tax=Triticum urartu TaxID=4572 RepID=A0A8R7V931_TRIUA
KRHSVGSLALGNGGQIGREARLHPPGTIRTRHRPPLRCERRHGLVSDGLDDLLGWGEDERRHRAGAPPPSNAGRRCCGVGLFNKGRRRPDSESSEVLAPEAVPPSLSGQQEVYLPRAELLGHAHGGHGALERHLVGVAQEPTGVPSHRVVKRLARCGRARVLLQLTRWQQYHSRRGRLSLCPHRRRRAAAGHAEPHFLGVCGDLFVV